jgi:hypothetical protein
MLIWLLEINSSVIVFNGLALLAALATLIVGQITDNQAMLANLLTPTQLLFVTLIQSGITMWLRNTNVTGQKPIEILPATTKDTKTK